MQGSIIVEITGPSNLLFSLTGHNLEQLGGTIVKNLKPFEKSI